VSPTSRQWNVVCLSEALLLAGRLDDARTVAERALSLAQEFRHRVCEPWALRNLAEIAARREPSGIAVAEGYYQQALALAEEFRMRPVLASCHLGLGRLYRRADRHAEADRHFSTARTLFRDMNMQAGLQQVEAELRHGDTRMAPV